MKHISLTCEPEQSLHRPDRAVSIHSCTCSHAQELIIGAVVTLQFDRRVIYSILVLE
jgi:hypothetical protein